MRWMQVKYSIFFMIFAKWFTFIVKGYEAFSNDPAEAILFGKLKKSIVIQYINIIIQFDKRSAIIPEN